MAEHEAGPGDGPRSIYLLRHAEKPPAPAAVGGAPGAAAGPGALGVDATGCVDDHSLTPRGWQRSGALAAFFGPGDSPTRNPQVQPPTRLFAPDYGSPTESARHRPHQTIEPLARRLGLPIETPVGKGAEHDLIHKHVLAATGADVLVCWEHEHISGLLAALAGAVTLQPAPGPGAHWPDDRFDMVLALTRAGDLHGGYRFAQLPQLLLDGDRPDPLGSI